MNVRVYRPNSELLSQLIDCFYLLYSVDNETNTVYLVFPSTFSIHTINFNTKIKSEGVRHKIYHDETVGISSSLVCRNCNLESETIVAESSFNYSFRHCCRSIWLRSWI